MSYSSGIHRFFTIFILSLFTLLFTAPAARAQFDYSIDGTVTTGKKKLEGAIVTLFKGSTQVQQVTTAGNGKFSFKLDPNANYTMSVTKGGYITKKFVFSTYGMPDDVAKTYEGGTKPEISIFEMPKDPNVVAQVNSILSQPMAKFSYDDRVKDIVYDKAYSESMLDALAKLNQIEKEAAQKQEEDAKKQQQLEAAAASQYQAAIAKGDAAFAKKDYVTARAAYTDALAVKPGEAYPKGKIVEIEKLAADAAKNAQLEADYKAALARGDAAMGTKDYAAAKAAYNDALKLKPDEAYPKGKLAEIDAAITKAAAEKELNDKYTAAIGKADKALAAKDYAAAKAGYNEALGLKPAEAYPKTRLAEIDKALADAAAKEKAAKELDEKYTAAIAKGDAALAAKTYDAAKAAYNEASGLKPAEAYPKAKLAEIDKALADAAAAAAAEKEKAAKEKELNDKYTAAITKGDAALAAKTYDAAKAAYTEASGLKPAEAYPKTKLAEIDKALADAAAAAAAAKEKAAKEKELNDKYTAALAKGDKALAAKDYTTAKAGYTEAAGLKPAEQYPKDKLAEIDKAVADAAAAAAAEKEKAAKEKELNDKYNAAIAKADAALKAKSYDAAKAGYNEALGLKPAEEYPKAKLAEIDKTLADLAAKDAADKEKAAKEKELNDKYTAAIAKGDAALKAKSYGEAKAGYNEALGLKPAEAYPKTRLAEIDKALADAAAKEKAEQDRQAKEKEMAEKYAAAISKADAAFTAKDYTNAKAGYTEALTYKASEQYPKDKIAEIDGIVAKALGEKALAEKYAAAVAKGDKALAARDYAGAKAGYTEASGLKPSEQYPKDKLAEVDKAMADAAAEKDKQAQAAALEAKYTAAIAKADKALAAKTYDAAKTAYNEALGVKPGEQYPKDKLAEIDKAVADAAAEKDKAAVEAKYKAAVAKGDAALKAKTYDAAKAAYNEALGVKPGEQYPKDKLAEIDGLIAKDLDAKALNDKYTAALAKGDAALKAKSYEDAKAAYNEALGLKPAEAYPKTKLAEIDKAIADAAAKDKAEQERLAKEKETNGKYTAAIAKGDAALGSKDYDAAKAAYTEASGLKPAEKYPKDKLAEINATLAKELGAKELEKKYADAVAKGDAALGTKDYAAAKAAYTDASGLKPAEQYPKDKLLEVEKALAEIAAAKDKEAVQKALEAKYAAALAKGDKALAAKTYEAAKAAYTEASGIKPDEQYPKDQLAGLDKLIAEAAASKDKAATDAKYNAAVAKGDAALKAKTYAAAKTAYAEASGIKPEEQYPKDKLAEIDKLMADAAAEKDKAALDAKYKAAVAKGDAALKAKTYDAAKAAYNDALAVKPEEQYPKDKLAEIDKIASDLANKDAASKALAEKYNAAISKADAALAAKDYDGAKAGYNEALGLKPAEKYPKDKLASIEALIAKDASDKEAAEKYKAAIDKGDAAFAGKDYAAAKTAYTEASTLKPSEQYPKDQLAKVSGYLADLAKNRAVQEKYDAAVKKADDLLAAAKYQEAIAAYKDAQAVKPNEPYPANKITEINKTLDDQAKAKEKDKQYADIIAKADKLFELKDLKSARNNYLDAALVKPSEKYPKDKVAEIDALLKKKNTAAAATTATGNKDDFKSELAKKYPEGITEESARENNAKVTRRIVVRGNEGHMYVRKETSFGPIYYFKDDVPITEQEFIRDTEVAQQ